jgi:tRNA uridine 5-carboxymethylaminomethyl modification enzyme
LEQTRIKIADIEPFADRFKKMQDISLAGLIRQPNLTVEQALKIIRSYDGFGSNSPESLERAAINIRYQGYIAKQQREIDKFKRQEKEAIPDGFDFLSITGLKREAAEKLTRFRPSSLGQAGRIEGVTPGDLAVLSVFVKRHKAG